MDNLQNLIESYLVSAEFNLLVNRDGLLVADRMILGDRDTRLIWIAPKPDIENPTDDDVLIITNSKY